MFWWIKTKALNICSIYMHARTHIFSSGLNYHVAWSIARLCECCSWAFRWLLFRDISLKAITFDSPWDTPIVVNSAIVNLVAKSAYIYFYSFWLGRKKQTRDLKSTYAGNYNGKSQGSYVEGLDVESRKDHSLPQNNTPDMDDAEQEAIVYLHGRQSQLTPGSSTKECH